MIRWAFLGGTACRLIPFSAMLLDPAAAGQALVYILKAYPLRLAAVLAFRAAGAWLGAWYSERWEHHPGAQNFRELVFRLYPFRLPAP